MSGCREQTVVDESPVFSGIETVNHLETINDLKTMPIDEVKSLLCSEVFQGWMQLNNSPATWLHKSWQDYAFPQVHRQLLQCKSVQSWVKKILELQGIEWRFFSTPLARVLFAPTQRLERIMTVLGALCYRIESKKIIEKRFHQQLSLYLDRVSLDYIEKTGPLLLAQPPHLFERLKACVPVWNTHSQALVNLTAIGEFIFTKALEREYLKGEGLKAEDFKAKGLRVKNHSSAEKIRVWQQYCSLKLPRRETTAPDFESLDISAISENELSRLSILIRKIIRHLEPQCLPLLK
ncbi:SctK family type III secretion system sorting platform protein [Marinibactrum halimedae]|uniref:Uncharacterized protein n=1 Tax=Marinibactrum halimedae TaxID=1444977 RepID=A0AA37WKX8_9GAMM|nr:SctK family type III secretion system sorting platform protein [Marinibactrum halimedae]MCD9459094.1 SctK family type III secretion system sorting platform protein [Marinibactrum halimedae]GLS24695.1 hypothetical protein GCM10007877_04090 [Marinibactrum halimedae]